jgi:hypothetical protein
VLLLGIKTNRDLKKRKNAKHSDTRLAMIAKIRAADKGIEQVGWAGQSSLGFSMNKNNNQPTLPLFYTSHIQVKQTVSEAIAKKSKADLKKDKEIKLAEAKDRYKTTIKALKQKHHKERKELEKELEGWRNGVSPDRDNLY